jgi:predicted NAD-dependent protein-ADP-ribosyltransferase YbiA (DUF1768 family)
VWQNGLIKLKADIDQRFKEWTIIQTTLFLGKSCVDIVIIFILYKSSFFLKKEEAFCFFEKRNKSNIGGNKMKVHFKQIGKKEEDAEKIINISSGSEDKVARKLSNFSKDRFVIDGREMASVEGFVQGIKFPEFPIEDTRRDIAFRLSGFEAKRIGNEAREFSYEFVWWQGKVIKYGSAEHYKLNERAIRAKFEQNSEAMEALLSTKVKNITHELGGEESLTTCLPKAIFCDILTRIRGEKLRELEEK